ncbi:MAG TPA: hypothetical protein VMJ30_09025 [Gemmatimonadales bacterium]|nr:hypothetical protein [Gemmatimonadales bacterium]
MRAPAASFFRYLWAFPNTILGLGFAGMAGMTGGRVRLVDGVLEAEGGWVESLLRRAVPLKGGAAAMTLGHVVLGRNAAALAATRRHERVHVRQCETWGPAFLPAYFAASLGAVFRGRHPYHGNAFEQAACREEAAAATR